MKAFERREAGIVASYKLAVWDDRCYTFREVKGTYQTTEAAKKGASKPGRYRISRVEEGRFTDAGTFIV